MPSDGQPLRLHLDPGPWPWVLAVALLLLGLFVGRLSGQVEGMTEQLHDQERELRLLQAYTVASAHRLVEAGLVEPEDVGLLVDASAPPDEEE